MDLPVLEAATDGFSDGNLLGRGGFGPVYKATLLDRFSLCPCAPVFSSVTTGFSTGLVFLRNISRISLLIHWVWLRRSSRHAPILVCGRQPGFYIRCSHVLSFSKHQGSCRFSEFLSSGHVQGDSASCLQFTGTLTNNMGTSFQCSTVISVSGAARFSVGCTVITPLTCTHQQFSTPCCWLAAAASRIHIQF